MIISYQQVISNYQELLLVSVSYQWLSMVIGYQQVVNCYQELLLVIS